MYEFIESSVFAKYIHDYLTDEEYAGLQWYLASRPDAGDLVPASGGCRKLRWGVTDKGKRGGVRVITARPTQDRSGCWRSMRRPGGRIFRPTSSA